MPSPPGGVGFLRSCIVYILELVSNFDLNSKDLYCYNRVVFEIFRALKSAVVAHSKLCEARVFPIRERLQQELTVDQA